MSGWLVGRVAAGDLPLEREVELMAWIRSLGQEPGGIREVTVAAHTDGHFACLEKLVGADDPELCRGCGALRVEHIVLPVEQGSWPTWLAGYGHRTTAG